ncbi:MAG TPA: 1-(5-phosphoribosyl)-5-[(5-phosphoribosylamino)methylideneamino] imidazole-4-carboxamide isomerase [Gammaproteobacteria bacterium]|nr:1-(5-phosphoribosyl)-5-[(5-phosphoribosylamino)methylideneamino] imidazole-4-carboxamide isomerase [Gammaproteobacteria bacterium]
MTFTVMPAIDLCEGRVVRLYQGDYTRKTAFAWSPLALAREYAAAGAAWLHVVDLDGARGGSLRHCRLLAAIADCGLKLQAGGGVRNEHDLEYLLGAGVERVVVGSLAVRDPQRVCQWVQQYGAERLTVALDTRWRNGRWHLPSAGWTQEEAATLDDLAPRYADVGVRHLLCTDIDRDGTLQGLNLHLYAHLRRIAPTAAVQASGGIHHLADIRVARESGAAGVVLGRALLERRFALADALGEEKAVAC